jgi:dihydrofolate reductase
MRKLIVFNNITLDGYFTDRNGDMSWAHRHDPEWMEFVQSNASGGGELLFGRKTYDLMASYWPTPMASKNDPVVAEQMNKLPKVVFSRAMQQASWQNTKVIKGEIAAEIRKMKSADGPGMAIFGSGTIVAQLAQENLIDEYQIAIHPIVLGAGRTMFDGLMFEGLKKKLTLRPTKTRTFGNGIVFGCYEVAD